MIKIKICDGITFRSPRAKSRTLTRFVNNVTPSGKITVRAHGFDHFIVRIEEISAHTPREDLA